MRLCAGLVALVLAFGGLSFAGPITFTVTPVAAPAGYTVEFANSINNLGQVAGSAIGPQNSEVAFISSGASSIALSLPVGFQPFGPVTFINDIGNIVVGAGESSAPFLFPAFFGNSSGLTMVPLPATARDGGVPTDVGIAGINNSGMFVGNLVSSKGGVQAYVGTASGLTGLSYEFGLGINNLGQILVDQSIAPTPPGYQVLIVTGSSTALIPQLPGNQMPTELNDNDQVVQGFAIPSVATTSGFTQIALTPGFGGGTAHINNNGVVAGTEDPSNGPAAGYIWDPINGTQMLSSLVPPGWTILTVQDINDIGQILAVGSFNGGPAESVILTPSAPEPATVLLAAIALLTLALLRCRYKPMM